MTSQPTAPATPGGSLDTVAVSWVADLVRREAAIVLDGKEYLVDSRLGALSRRLGMPDAAAVVRAAQRGDRTAQAGIVDALTTNETSWFRDGGPFEALRRQILPALVRERATDRSLRIWSAACSSGQEAYSVAMVCREVVPAGWRVDILGTDLSGEILARARSGRYSQLEVNRGLPAPLLVQWLRRAGTEWEVVPELRDMVRWDRLNLARPFPPLGRFDVVLLRNVLIYFDPPTKGAVLDRVRGVLRPDGYLLLGGAETTIGLGDTWQREVVAGAPAWRLAGAAPVVPAPRSPIPSPVPQRGGR
jgi:chemotaxis protein methyltransferase CheR